MNLSSKITLFFIISLFFACSEVRKIKPTEYLLHENKILVNGKVNTSEEVENQLYQRPNSRLLGFKSRLQIYNLTKKNADSSYNAWLLKTPNRKKKLVKLLSEKQVEQLGKTFIVSGYNNLFKKIGEPPAIFDVVRTDKSKKRLKNYFENRGFFDVNIFSKIDTLKNRRIKANYQIETGQPYIIDSLFRKIENKVIDSLYVSISDKSLIKTGDAYNAENIRNEKKRIVADFRNKGLYHFQENYIKQPDIDTIGKKNKLNFTFNIGDRVVKEGDSLKKIPFKIYKISRVNVFTDKQSNDKTAAGIDSLTYNGYNLYSSGKFKYLPKAITNTIFIEKGKVFSEEDKLLTTNALSNLKVFSFPRILYTEDANKNTLTANIILSPLKKYQFNINFDVTHSNIQDYGITGFLGVTFRNVFKGAETLNFALRGNLGASREIANFNNEFFNLSEFGADLKLNFPRIFFPIKTSRLIGKEMSPNTSFLINITKQTNIGLDKESYAGNLFYEWKPRINRNIRLELFNLQFIRNLNTSNYFNVYQYSYNVLNDFSRTYLGTQNNLTFPEAIGFVNAVVSGNTVLTPNDQDYRTISSLGERRLRLIENNLILSSSLSYNHTTQADVNDDDFYNFKTKIESSGNILELIAKWKKEEFSANGNQTIFGVEYAQYIKAEAEFIKHIHLRSKSSFAMRFFGGIAVPYGNARNIPFSRSYFAGGSNDNRGWQAYSLGPGSSDSRNDFNEANFKIASNFEYRFNVFNSFNAAVFADAGNIWNIYDNVTDTKQIFNGLKSFGDLALGTGFGIRYDFKILVARIDFGYKTFNPAKPNGEKWFRDVNIGKTVYNFGINYPF